ncbi:MAG TPA: hypothetical protein VNI83_00610 [Vicinamibacterales bacterium]|nr:hypothetical protein [Vicinamibacterales bacterium]
MVPLPNLAGLVLADLLRRQPFSPGKVALAWKLAVGPALARVSEAEPSGEPAAGRPLRVRARVRDGRWAAELRRSKATIAGRLEQLLDRPVELVITGQTPRR